MFLNHCVDSVTGCIEKVELDRLPNHLKDEFLNSIQVIKSQDGLVEFVCINHEDAPIFEKIHIYQKRKLRSEIRKDDLYILSSGTYTADDIEQIFDIQKGACYYTGSPLTKSPKNYAIDHIVPVVDCGSSWPSNLALTTIDANSRKHNHSKRKFFSSLEKLKGKDWADNQRGICKQIDQLRKQIDKDRRQAISEKLKATEQNIKSLFPDDLVVYGLINDHVTLEVNGIEVRFPAGFLRLESKCFSVQYIEIAIKSLKIQ